MKAKRILLIDELKGWYAILMVLAHTSNFFYDEILTNIIVQIIRHGTGVVCLTGFCLCFGITSYTSIMRKPFSRHVVSKVMRQSSIYFLIYCLYTIITYWVFHGWENTPLWEYITFIHPTGFFEFMNLFVVFPFILLIYIIFTRFLRLPSILTVSLTPAIGLISFIIARYLYLTYSTHYTWYYEVSIKAQIFGYGGLYTYPILAYLFPYFFGIFIGYGITTFTKKTTQLGFLFTMEAVCLSGFIALFSQRIIRDWLYFLYNRWPPTLDYLLAGCVGFFTFALILYPIQHNKITMILSWYGKHTLSILFFHILFIVMTSHFGLIQPTNKFSVYILYSFISLHTFLLFRPLQQLFSKIVNVSNKRSFASSHHK